MRFSLAIENFQTFDPGCRFAKFSVANQIRDVLARAFLDFLDSKLSGLSYVCGA